MLPLQAVFQNRSALFWLISEHRDEQNILQTSRKLIAFVRPELSTVNSMMSRNISRGSSKKCMMDDVVMLDAQNGKYVSRNVEVTRDQVEDKPAQIRLNLFVWNQLESMQLLLCEWHCLKSFVSWSTLR